MKVPERLNWGAFLTVWLTALGCHSESDFFPDTSSFELVKMDDVLQNINPTIAVDYSGEPVQSPDSDNRI